MTKSQTFLALESLQDQKNIVFFPRDYSVFRIVQFGEKNWKKKSTRLWSSCQNDFFHILSHCEICISYLKYFSNFSGKKYGKIISFFVLSSCCPYFSRYIQIHMYISSKCLEKFSIRCMTSSSNHAEFPQCTMSWTLKKIQFQMCVLGWLHDY